MVHARRASTGGRRNVAIVTGSASGFWVLDVDPEKGGEASSLAQLVAAYGPLPTTVEAITGGGGRHLLFKHPGERIPNGLNRFGPGIERKEAQPPVQSRPFPLPRARIPERRRGCPTGRNRGENDAGAGRAGKFLGERWRPHRDSNCTEPANHNPATTHAKAEFARESGGADRQERLDRR